MAKVKVRKENTPKGQLVEVVNLGEFENGSTTELDPGLWNRYRRRYNLDLPDDHTLEIGEGQPPREAIRLVPDAESESQSQEEQPNVAAMNKAQLVELAESRAIATEGKSASDLRQELSSQ